MEPILSLKNVCSYYDKVQVLYDINVDVYPGEIVSVIGANGAGKSTMMKTIMGLVHMGRGEVTFDGKKLNRMHAHKICKAGIAYVPEGREVFPNMTVLENLEMGAYCRSYTAAQMNEKLEEMYTMFPRLKERLKQKAGSMSGGEQQRVSLARALVNNPPILLADEPTGNLDPTNAWEIMMLLEDINKRGTTVVVVTHNQDIVERMQKRVITIDKGVVVSDEKGGITNDR
mgnify:CR=1 FL=1